MVKDIQLRLTLKDEERSDILLIKAAQYLSIPKKDISGIKVLRKSIDARKPYSILFSTNDCINTRCINNNPSSSKFNNIIL